MKTLVNRESFCTLGREFHEGIIEYYKKKMSSMKPEFISSEVVVDIV